MTGKIAVRFSFLLFNALVFMFRDTALILGFYAACILHEAGHVIAICLTHGEIYRVELSCFGIRIESSPSRTVREGIFVLLSGPFVNLMTFFILSAAEKSGFTAIFSLLEGIFNLLPFSFLDGGAVLESMASGSEHEDVIRMIMAVLRGFAALVILLFIACLLVTA